MRKRRQSSKQKAISRPPLKRRQEAAPPANLVSREVRVSSGPLPPPEALQKYDAILPGAAERIFRMAEKEQEHAHGMTRTVTRDITAYTKRGQICGVIVALIAFATTAWLGYMGHATASAVVGGGAVAGLVSVFITGKRGAKIDPPG